MLQQQQRNTRNHFFFWKMSDVLWKLCTYFVWLIITVRARNEDNQMAKLKQYLSVLYNTGEQDLRKFMWRKSNGINYFLNQNYLKEATSSDEIGPNFNEAQFLRMLKRDSQAAFQRKCKKNSGSDNAYIEAAEARRQMKTCVTNWFNSEGLDTDSQQAKIFGNYKPLVRK